MDVHPPKNGINRYWSIPISKTTQKWNGPPGCGSSWHWRWSLPLASLPACEKMKQGTSHSPESRPNLAESWWSSDLYIYIIYIYILYHIMNMLYACIILSRQPEFFDLLIVPPSEHHFVILCFSSRRPSTNVPGTEVRRIPGDENWPAVGSIPWPRSACSNCWISSCDVLPIFILRGGTVLNETKTWLMDTHGLWINPGRKCCSWV